MSQISNALNMAIVLKSRGPMKISQLAKELEVSERTVRSYKNDLEQAGIYVKSTAGPFGGYCLEDDQFLYLNLNLKEWDLEVLELAKVQLESIGFIYQSQFDLIVDRLRVNYSKKDQRLHLRETQSEYLVKYDQSESYEEEREKALHIRAAIIGKRKILLNYFSMTSGLKERVVQPYAVFNYKGALYVVGYCENRKAVIDFKLCRIKSYEVLDEYYELPKDFSLKNYLDSSFGIYKDKTVALKLKIEKPMSYIVSEKKWSKHQNITWNDDESIIFECELKGEEEIISWIMSMRNHVKVIEPLDLKNKIIYEIEKLKNIYENY
jgi:predicted DNA-binding transcriptional regulator YafY